MFRNESLYRVERKSPVCIASVLLMLLSACLRIAAYCRGWRTGTGLFAWILLALPLFANLFFVFSVCRWGSRDLRPTVLAVFTGVIFFAGKAAEFPLWQRILCDFLYCLILVLYTAVMFGVIRNKKILYLLFGLPLFVHAFILDLIDFLREEEHILAVWLQEFSVLCIMASLLLISAGMIRILCARPD